MRDEPASQQQPLATLNVLTTRGYLLLAHIAAARRLSARPDASNVEERLTAARRELGALLGSDVTSVPSTPSPDPLSRRLDAARTDAQAVVTAARTLGVAT